MALLLAGLTLILSSHTVIRILLILLGSSQVVSQDPCVLARRLPEAPYSRSSQPAPKPSEVYLCDMYSFISDEWIRFDRVGMDAMGFHMPEQCVTGPRCGTMNAVWMNGTHPTETSPGPIDAFSCMRTSDDDCCGWRQPLQVKWCSPGFFAYKAVPPPSCYFSYCFEEVIPEYQYPPLDFPVLGAPFISDARITKTTYPLLNRNATGTGIINATVFSMGCTVKFIPGINRADLEKDIFVQFRYTPVITVEFVIRLPDGLSYITILSYTHTSFEEKEYFITEDLLQGHMDQSILCRTISNWARTPNVHSLQMLSEERKLEFRIISDPSGSIITSRVITIREGQKVVFHLKPSFQLTNRDCYMNASMSSAPICYYTYFITNVIARWSPYKVYIFAKNCKIPFFPDVPYPLDADIEPIKITVTIDATIGTRFQGISYLNFFPAYHQTYENTILLQPKFLPIPIKIIDAKPRPKCGSGGDPHFTRFYRSDVYHIAHTSGEFTLVRLCEVGGRKLEIQVKHKPCIKIDQVYDAVCNCGIMIREDNNVVGINACGGIGLAPLIIKYQTRKRDSNGNPLPQPSIVWIGTSAWKITLLSGIEIYVYHYNRNILNIFVIGLAYEKYCGLCSHETDESNFLQYRVSISESLFRYIAQCVDEYLPNTKCACESDSLQNVANLVCKNERNPTNVAYLTPRSAGLCDIIVSGQANAAAVPVPGQAFANAMILDENNDQTDADSFVVEDDIILSKETFEDGDTTTSETTPTVWPTPHMGITQAQAQAKCQQVLESSPAYDLCKDQVNSTALLESCVLDIQLTENLDFANMYMSWFNRECLYKVESSIVLDENGTDTTGNNTLLEEIRELVCPLNCVYNNSRSGDCVNLTCQCYQGFKGQFCEIKIGAVPTIVGLVEDVIDYRERNITKTKQILILLGAQDVDTETGAPPTCHFSLHTDPSLVDPLSEKTVTGVLLAGGMVACTMNVDIELINAEYRLDVSISNDAIIYSNSKSIILYDGSCMNCTTATHCSLKRDGFMVAGVCVDQVTPTQGPTSGNCRWLNYDNSHSWYGKKQQGAADVTECERLCCQNSSCVALDFDSKVYYADSCWFHADITLVDGTRHPNPGIFQRVKVACRTCDSITWASYPDKTSPGGEKMSQFSTVESCKDFCECKKNCAGIEFNRVSNECWIHTDRQNLKSNTDQPNTDQYVMSCGRPRAEGCFAWDILNSTHSAGARYYESLVTLSSCLSHCQHMNECVAADINTDSDKPFKCWLHLDQQLVDTYRQADPTVNQYIARRCSNMCSALWVPYPGHQSFGGRKQEGVITAEGCRVICEGVSDCVGVDFNKATNQCYLMFDLNAVVSKRVNTPNVNQFILIRSKACVGVSWTLKPGTHSEGTTRDQSAVTVEDCKQICEDDLSCVAVEWKSTISPPQCYIQRNINDLINSSADPTTDQYRITRP